MKQLCSNYLCIDFFVSPLTNCMCTSSATLFPVNMREIVFRLKVARHLIELLCTMHGIFSGFGKKTIDHKVGKKPHGAIKPIPNKCRNREKNAHAKSEWKENKAQPSNCVLINVSVMVAPMKQSAQDIDTYVFVCELCHCIKFGLVVSTALIDYWTSRFPLDVSVGFFLFLVLFYFLCDRFFFSPSLVFAKNSVQQRMNRFARFSRARARSLSPCHFHDHAIASAENLSQSNQEKYSSCGCDYMTRTQRNTYSTLIVPPMCSANVCIITRHLYHYHVPNVHTF